ncbi:MAG: paraquat-inducible protein A [Planctomycetota bacterium]
MQATIGVATVLLGLGLVAPAMTLRTSFGAYDGWVRLLAPDLAAGGVTTYSLASGIWTLLQSSFWIGVLLVVFTCVFPAAKLAVMSAGVEALRQGRDGGWWVKLAHHTGKFSMLDVLVLAMLVLAIKGLPGQSELLLGYGVWLFAGSVVLSLAASLMMKRLEGEG